MTFDLIEMLLMKLLKKVNSLNLIIYGSHHIDVFIIIRFSLLLIIL